MKRCNKCGELKPLSEYYKTASISNTSYRSDCKSCCRNYNWVRYHTKLKHDQDFKEYQKKYNSNYYFEKAKNKDFHKNRYKRNQLKWNAYARAYYKYGKIPLKFCETCKEYYPKNSDFFLIQRGNDDDYFPVCIKCSNNKYKLQSYWATQYFDTEI